MKLCLKQQKNIRPKTVSPKKMKENLRFIKLEEEDLSLLEALPYIGGHAHNPDEVEF